VSRAEITRGLWRDPERRGAWVGAMRAAWTPERREAHSRRVWARTGPPGVPWERRFEYRRLRRKYGAEEARRIMAEEGE
jgi:hypothetical protein